MRTAVRPSESDRPSVRPSARASERTSEGPFHLRHLLRRRKRDSVRCSALGGEEEEEEEESPLHVNPGTRRPRKRPPQPIQSSPTATVPGRKMTQATSHAVVFPPTPPLCWTQEQRPLPELRPSQPTATAAAPRGHAQSPGKTSEGDSMAKFWLESSQVRIKPGPSEFAPLRALLLCNCTFDGQPEHDRGHPGTTFFFANEIRPRCFTSVKVLVDCQFALLAGRQLERPPQRQEVLQDGIAKVHFLLEGSLPPGLLHHERLGEGRLRESVSGTKLEAFVQCITYTYTY